LKKLTPKQKLFCEYYVIDKNASAAALKAGYSKKTAKAIGHENLTKPNIKKFIQEHLKKQSEKIGISFDDVIDGLEIEAKGDGEDTKTTARITAWTQIGKLLGYYSADNAQKGDIDLKVRAEVVEDLVRAVDGITRGLPKPVGDK